jgi:mannose-6-phosphate isomerase-like protein (cupin superfamily)
VDHTLTLPTGDDRPERSFGGQRFVHHQAARAAPRPWRTAGLEARDLGIAAATGGLAGAWVLRATGAVPLVAESHAGELAFTFVLAGGARLALQDRPSVLLRADDAFVVPAGLVHALEACSRDLELLHVTLPADAGVVRHAGRPRGA